MTHHHIHRAIVAATAIAIALTACGDDTTVPGPAVGADVVVAQPENVQPPAPVEVGRSQRLIEESIQDALASRQTSATGAHPARQLPV